MSVMIKGMDMPSKCRFCPCCVDNGLIGMQREYFCSALDSALGIDNLEQKLSACPLVGISTPHGRLIDADNLKCALSWQGEVVRATVREAPTIIEAEVSE